jgi:hypothetical protein
MPPSPDRRPGLERGDALTGTKRQNNGCSGELCNGRNTFKFFARPD